MTGPYKVGDLVTILHSDKGIGTHLATFRVERVKALAVNGQHRITVTRCDGTALEVEVNTRGVDTNDYVRPGGAA